MKQKMNLKEKLYSTKNWRLEISPRLVEHFSFLGFNCPKDFTGIRLFDLLNLNLVDCSRAAEILTELSEYLFPCRVSYDGSKAAESRAIRTWMEDHGDFSTTLIGDLLLDDSLSLEAALKIFDQAAKSFYHSSEYNTRCYRYGNICEICYPFPAYA